MTVRRSLGALTLLAMMHFIILGTASACATSHNAAHSAASAHTDCAPTSSHTRGGTTGHTSEIPCCAALSSCTVAPLAAHTVAIEVAEPAIALASAITDRAPRSDAPAPELPPPKA
jgi:hypothetical protein